MSDDNSDSYFVPAPGEAGGSPKPPPGEEAPDAPSLSLIHISEPTRPY